MSTGIQAINDQVKENSVFIAALRAEMEKVIVGQKYLIDRLIIGLLANGHILLEGVPGLAKTLSVRTLASALNTSFQRIQFTPDLLPADLIGTQIYNPKDGNFTTKQGPVFTNIILADEINRAPAKVQSALLEAMQEHQVTIGHETFRLPEPFLVMATENPIEQEGTYPLPEAQVDRFMLKLNITYPTLEEERKILDAMSVTNKTFDVKPVVDPQAIINARKIVDEIYLDDKIKEYILSIVFSTREPQKYNLKIEDYLRYGASPRATIYLTLGARAHAFLEGRGYVTPQDVKSIAPDVLRHRVIVSYEAEAEELTSNDIVKQILNELPVP
ncbi:MAG: MoxR family ATPase [Spartobacteria bacterium]|nr:MoxR family ATPase [Spartobacteria bacterium]